ncbi:hypothetical protein PHJA_002940700 [Phtheirospermum japonicum]|uniref:Uncharacterized protein n=1 Tax=Phtheirospermum japonicum TaxID=374723 RepID=A0A830D8A7_9LAMI|nr:hypothetical protein PHJA_002940700 [Phtheirospermum japonicum]
MENSQSLATESFSYSWLADKKPQHSYVDNNNNHNNPSENFNFDFPFTSSQIAPVHADEIFSGGQMKYSQPVYIDTSTMKNSKSTPQSPVSSHQFVSSGNQTVLLGKWGKSSKRFLRGVFGILNPLIGCSRKSNRVDDFERVQSEASPRSISANSVVGNKKDFNYGLKKAKSCNNSAQASPRIGPSYSSNSWSCDVESSIHEAILKMRGFAVYTKKNRLRNFRNAWWNF